MSLLIDKFYMRKKRVYERAFKGLEEHLSEKPSSCPQLAKLCGVPPRNLLVALRMLQRKNKVGKMQRRCFNGVNRQPVVFWFKLATSEDEVDGGN